MLDQVQRDERFAGIHAAIKDFTTRLADAE
jgi:hypothetical protein